MSENHTDDEHDLLDLAHVYALGAISEVDRADIAGRLGAAAPHTAREFARIVAETQETMALATAGDALAPPQELRERLLRAIDTGPTTVGSDDEVADRRTRRRRRITRAVLAAAAAVVVGIGTTVAIRQLDRPASVLTVEQVLASPDTHTSITDVAGGTLTLSSSGQANAVVVEMSDVPPPPEGHVYQMWFVPASGEPRSAGTMSATTMPPPGGEVITDLGATAAVTVTVEPGTGSAQPTGTPVVTIPLT